MRMSDPSRYCFYFLFLLPCCWSGCSKDPSLIRVSRSIPMSYESKGYGQNPSIRVRNIYDEHFRITHRFFYRNDTLKYEIKNYRYDAVKREIQAECFSSGGQKHASIHRIYDPAGNEIYRQFKKYTGDLYTFQLRYNHENRKTGEKIYYNGELAKETENYIYDEYGNPLHFESRYFFSFPFPTTGPLSSGYYSVTFLNLLDEKLRIVQRIKYAYGMPSEIWKDYQYDESGNPVYWFYYNRHHVTRTYKIDWYQAETDPEIVFYPSPGPDQILWEYSFLYL